jgi:hypothetical protein
VRGGRFYLNYAGRNFVRHRATFSDGTQKAWNVRGKRRFKTYEPVIHAKIFGREPASKKSLCTIGPPGALFQSHVAQTGRASKSPMLQNYRMHQYQNGKGVYRHTPVADRKDERVLYNKQILKENLVYSEIAINLPPASSKEYPIHRELRKTFGTRCVCDPKPIHMKKAKKKAKGMRRHADRYDTSGEFFLKKI